MSEGGEKEHFPTWLSGSASPGRSAGHKNQPRHRPSRSTTTGVALADGQNETEAFISGLLEASHLADGVLKSLGGTADPAGPSILLVTSTRVARTSSLSFSGLPWGEGPQTIDLDQGSAMVLVVADGADIRDVLAFQN